MSSSTTHPEQYPFTIRQLNSTTHLIRETDMYGEYPHIYAKVVFPKDAPLEPALIVLSDTGCGTSRACKDALADVWEYAKPAIKKKYGEYNLGTFLEHTLNPGGKLPCLVITTHCHYDHILGLKTLPSTKSDMTTVVSSSHKKSFIVPRSNLAENSLCNDIRVPPPHYDITWAADREELKYHRAASKPDKGRVVPPDVLDTNLTILHTPGHTPDSLTWYDSHERLICVGDSLYERESPESRTAGEPPMPTIFDIESDLLDWWDSLKEVLKFVQGANEELEKEEVETSETEGDHEWVELKRKKKPRVKLCAAHVTANVDAETCLLEMQDFMRRLLRYEIRSKPLGRMRGEETNLWDWANTAGRKGGRFSVQAPYRVIMEGRESIPKDEIGKRPLVAFPNWDEIWDGEPRLGGLVLDQS